MSVTERLSATAGVVASLAVGIPVLLDQIGGGAGFVSGPLWAWWPAYLGHLGAFLLIDSDRRRPQWLSDRRLLAIQTVLGGGAYAIAPRFGWVAVLLVVTAVTAAYVLGPRATIALVVAQTAFIAAVSLLIGAGPYELILTVVVYGSFQVFGVMTVWSTLREADARARLAEANAELRAATALLAESSRTTERLRIARDLHDLVGHQLTALALELEVASHRSTPPASKHVTRARRIAKDLLSDVRAAVGELRAPTPGLRSALHSVAAGVPRPEVHLQVPEDLVLDDERTLALIRCTQEIVTNAVRHADAGHLWIELSSSPREGIRLEARDDGHGVADLRLGNGLTGMRERVEQLGGQVRFHAGQGGGFRVVAEVPAS